MLKKIADNVKRKGPGYFFIMDRILHLHVVYIYTCKNLQ
jgi:hypothetical protein